MTTVDLRDSGSIKKDAATPVLTERPKNSYAEARIRSEFELIFTIKRLFGSFNHEMANPHG